MKTRITKSAQSAVLSTLIAAQLCAFAPLPSFAAASAVRVAGQQVFSISTAGGGMTVSDRAATIQKNIDNALVATPNKTPSAVGVTYVKGLPVVTLGGFYVTTVDSATAKANGTTPSVLAQRWSNALKTSLKDSAAVNSYVAQLTGSGSSTVTAGTTTTETGSYPYYQQGRIVYIPAGMTLPVSLSTSVSSANAKAGDRIEAKLAETVNLGETNIPEGSVVLGHVTEANAGARLGKSGMLGVKFNTLRTPNGQETPISAHIVGGIGKYEGIGSTSNLVKGETTGTKVKKALIHGGVGAGGGALLGTTIGAIAGGGRGAGRGAIFGTAIGAGLGVAESLLYRKGEDVKVESGQTLKLQLDAPASLAM
jgi:hypothetical protein